MPNNLRSRRADIAVLGPKNTNTDLAATRYEKSLKKKLKKIYLPTIMAVVKAVAAGRSQKGIVPLENSTTGKVKETERALKKYKVRPMQKLQFPAKYALVMLPSAKKKDMKIIVSHEQALRQCKKYVKKHYPRCRTQKYSSTIAALAKIIKTKNRYAAAIIPLRAVQDYKLEIVARNIQNRPKNVTTFLLIASVV